MKLLVLYLALTNALLAVSHSKTAKISLSLSKILKIQGILDQNALEKHFKTLNSLTIKTKFLPQLAIALTAIGDPLQLKLYPKQSLYNPELLLNFCFKQKFIKILVFLAL